MQIRPLLATKHQSHSAAPADFSNLLHRSITRYLDTQADKSLFRENGLIDPHKISLKESKVRYLSPYNKCALGDITKKNSLPDLNLHKDQNMQERHQLRIQMVNKNVLKAETHQDAIGYFARQYKKQQQVQQQLQLQSKSQALSQSSQVVVLSPCKHSRNMSKISQDDSSSTGTFESVTLAAKPMATMMTAIKSQSRAQQQPLIGTKSLKHHNSLAKCVVGRPEHRQSFIDFMNSTHDWNKAEKKRKTLIRDASVKFVKSQKSDRSLQEPQKNVTQELKPLAQLSQEGERGGTNSSAIKMLKKELGQLSRAASKESYESTQSSNSLYIRQLRQGKNVESAYLQSMQFDLIISNRTNRHGKNVPLQKTLKQTATANGMKAKVAELATYLPRLHDYSTRNLTESPDKKQLQQSVVLSQSTISNNFSQLHGKSTLAKGNGEPVTTTKSSSTIDQQYNKQQASLLKLRKFGDIKPLLMKVQQRSQQRLNNNRGNSQQTQSLRNLPTVRKIVKQKSKHRLNMVADVEAAYANAFKSSKKVHSASKLDDQSPDGSTLLGSSDCQLDFMTSPKTLTNQLASQDSTADNSMRSRRITNAKSKQNKQTVFVRYRNDGSASGEAANTTTHQKAESPSFKPDFQYQSGAYSELNTIRNKYKPSNKAPINFQSNITPD